MKYEEVGYALLAGLMTAAFFAAAVSVAEVNEGAIAAAGAVLSILVVNAVKRHRRDVN